MNYCLREDEELTKRKIHIYFIDTLNNYQKRALVEHDFQTPREAVEYLIHKQSQIQSFGLEQQNTNQHNNKHKIKNNEFSKN